MISFIIVVVNINYISSLDESKISDVINNKILNYGNHRLILRNKNI